MDIFGKTKLKFNEIVDKNRRTFDSKCNIRVKLLMHNRQLDNAIRSDDGKSYTFYHKAPLRMHELLVDENNRLVEIVEVSNVLSDENELFEYKIANVIPYVNPTGIVSLSANLKATETGNIIIQSSGGDVSISNSTFNNSTQIVLSILQNVDLKSAWNAIKQDLYQLYDYERYADIVDAIDRHFKGEEIKKERFEKCLEKAKGIASVLGAFVGALLSELVKK